MNLQIFCGLNHLHQIVFEQIHMIEFLVDHLQVALQVALLAESSIAAEANKRLYMSVLLQVVL